MRGLLLTASLIATMGTALPAARAADPVAARYRLVLSKIAAARRTQPRAFEVVAAVKAKVPELDRRKRGRLAPVAPLLRALGPSALMPMLEALTSTRLETLEGSARLAWRVGLLEAVGALRDPRATVVLRRQLERETDPSIIRAATAALGKLGDEEAVGVLRSLAEQRGPRQLAVISGLGECRRLSMARALAGMLARHPADEGTARAIAKALGELGSAWAWETPRLAALNEGAAVRAVAADALLGAFVRSPEPVRDAAETAILLVDAPDMLERIARARASAVRSVQAELDRLARRVEHSPLRPRATHRR